MIDFIRAYLLPIIVVFVLVVFFFIWAVDTDFGEKLKSDLSFNELLKVVFLLIGTLAVVVFLLYKLVNFIL